MPRRPDVTRVSIYLSDGAANLPEGVLKLELIETTCDAVATARRGGYARSVRAHDAREMGSGGRRGGRATGVASEAAAAANLTATMRIHHATFCTA